MILTNLQSEAVNKFKDKSFGAIFMDMGTGKTKVALKLAKIKTDTDLLLYVCPNSTKKQVHDEIKLENIEIEYLIVSYQSIAESDNIYVELIEKIKYYKNIFIIADESTNLKNNNKTYGRMIEIRKYCKYALILTGTPITNDELDIYNQFEFLSSKILKMTSSDFISNFYDKITYKRKGKKEKSFFKFSNVNREYLQKIIDAVSIQGSLEIDFDIDEVFKFETPNDSTLEKYGEKRTNFLEKIINGEISDSDCINFLTYSNKLFSLDENKNKEVANIAKDRKVIVFSAFREEQNQICSNLNNECFVINGEVNDRDDILKMFYESINKPLLITYGVGGIGLNLQTSNEIIFSSVLFDWEKMEQSKGRIARIGQKSKIIKYNYILSESKITKMILENLKRKDGVNSLIKEIINGKCI